MFFGSVDQELLPIKSFYFFFYSAFGSLFPLMGIYFKQMGMNPGQCGLLIGTRPFVEFLSAPFWGSYADRCKKGKILLLASIGAWIIFTLPLGFIQPPATSCIQRHNATDYELRTPQVTRILKRSITLNELNETFDKMQQESTKRYERAARPRSEAGQSPLDVSYANNFVPSVHSNWVSPLFSSIVYRTEVYNSIKQHLFLD